jgi:hypothetical protein
VQGSLIPIELFATHLYLSKSSFIVSFNISTLFSSVMVTFASSISSPDSEVQTYVASGGLASATHIKALLVESYSTEQLGLSTMTFVKKPNDSGRHGVSINLSLSGLSLLRHQEICAYTKH